MPDIKWIKIVTDIFDNRKIKQIEKLPEGDSILVVWFKILCLAGNINDRGYIYLTQEIPYTEETLSVEFNRPINIIKLALSTFRQFNMIEIIDNMLRISSWDKYQNVGGMERIREQTRLRVSEYRERKKLTGNVTVTLSNATDKNREDKNREEKDITPSKSAAVKPEISEIINYLNTKLKARYSDKSKSTVSHITARLKEGRTVQDFKTVIDKKCAEWQNDSKMCIFLRPETLFCAEHFDSYLNQPLVEPKRKGHGYIERNYEDGQLAEMLKDNTNNWDEWAKQDAKRSGND